MVEGIQQLRWGKHMIRTTTMGTKWLGVVGLLALTSTAAADGADVFYGSFNESIGIEVPAYHGVEPKLALNYNSGGGASIVGTGWEFSGFSMIERTNDRRGAPDYLTTDIYLLDGQELLSCGGAVVSPGCSNGGTHTSGFESYTKVVFASATNTWTITQKDGSTAVLSSVLTTAGGTFRWGLTSVRDKIGNTATYAWWCDTTMDCYPSTVTYGSVTVTLYRELHTNPIYFANGKTVGLTRYRIKAIDIKLGASRVRTYALAYGTSASTGRSTLSSVQQFGSDAVVDAAGVITNSATATKLPATTAAYSTSTTSLTAPVTTIAQSNSNNGDHVADFNGDGRDDLLVWHHRNYTTTDAPSGHYRYILYKSNAAGGFDPPVVTIARSYDLSSDKIGDFNGDGMADLLVWHYRNSTTTDNPIGTNRYVLYLSNGNGFNAPITTIAQAQHTPGDKVADFNGDGKADLLVWHYRNYTTTDAPIGNYRYNLYLSTGSGLAAPIATIATSYSSTTDKIGDFDGDGKSDLLVWHYKTSTTVDAAVATNRYTLYTSFGTAFGAPVVTIAQSNNTIADHVGDFNGDGKSDLLIWHYRNYTTVDAPVGNYRYNIYHSNGTGLSAPVATIARGYDLPGDHVADFNGDGRSDLLVWHYRTLTTTDNPVGNNRYNLYLSDGYDLITPVTTIARAFSLAGDHTGDFNGDGKADLIVWNYKNLTTTDNPVGTNRYNIYKSGGAPVDLLSTLTSSLGGITTIAYTPSSAWVNTNNPPIGQTVLSTTQNDGRGTLTTTTFSYTGGLYDYLERRFLGFRYGKETEPCITGETQCPYTETWFKQDYGSASKPEQIDVRDGSGKILSSSVFTYTTNGATEPYTSLETARWQYLYDGSGTACAAWPCTFGKRTYLTRQYDTYGNTVLETAYGNYDGAGDDVTTATTYYPNTAQYMLSYPALVKVHSGLTTAGTVLHETRLFYDQLTSHTTAPTVGLLRKESKWLSTDGSFANTEFTYDAFGQILTSKNAMGGTTSTVYDATYQRYPTSRTDALGRVTTATYHNVCGKAASVTLSDGRATTFQYDALCRETRSDVPGGDYTIHTYVSLGSPTLQYSQIQTPGAGGTVHWTKEYFDGLGRTWRKEAKGNVTGQEIREDVIFDVRGNSWKKTGPYLANATPTWIIASFDQRDRVTRVTNPDATFQTTSYGVWSSTITDEAGRWTTEIVNGKGQITERTEKLGAGSVKTSYYYDTRGNPQIIMDDAGNFWTFVFDSLGRRTSVYDPNTGTTTFVFDAGGREVSRLDANGKTTTHTYDALGRVTQRVHGAGQAGSITATFAYDQARTGYYNTGKLTTVTDPLGSQTIDHDIAGNVVRSTRIISGTSYTFTKGFDTGGRLLWTTYPDGDTVGTVAAPLTYDATGNLLTIPGYMTTASYDAAGRVLTYTLTNGVVTTRAYSANRGWLNSLSTVKGAVTLQNLTYTRNSVGQVTTLASAKANEGWTYAYDDLGRLTSATNTTSSTHNQTFVYNNVGNMTSNSRLGTYGYAAAGSARPHAVATAGANTYAYDAAGNMTSGAGRTMTWDAAGRPSQINTHTYGYDGSGERITRTEGATTTHYVGSDYEVAAGIVTKYISVGTTRIAKKVGATKYWLHSDHLGSVQAVTDAAGLEVQRLVYRPYGERLSSSTGHAQTRGYTGQTEDASGLTFLNARYYDSALGRFVSADPTMPTDTSMGLNRYAYAGNDPVNQTDIDGLGLFKKVKKFFKKVGKALKKVGQTLQKWAAAVAKLPVLGGIAGLVLNTIGALFQGDWATALRGFATVAIILGTIYVSGAVNAAIGMGQGFLTTGARMAAQAAVGGASGYLSARVQGASHAEALKAGIAGAKLGFSMEAFSSFIDAIPGSDKWKMGTKTDAEGSCRPNSPFGKWADKARAKFNEFMAEESWFSEKFLGKSSMRGTQKLMSYMHDHFMVAATKHIGDGTWYPGGALGSTFNPAAGTGFELMLIEYPINFGSIWMFEKGFALAGEKLESRLSAGGNSTLGYLANATLNPFMGFQDAAEYGARARMTREYMKNIGQ